MAAQRSIVICGGAFAGLALGVALRQGLGADIPIIVADPALATRPSRDPRATAIVAACRRLLHAVGAWDRVAADAQPILDMVVTDSKLEDATRPVFLTFRGNVEPGEPFAHMVENRHLIDALVQRAEEEGVDLRACAVANFSARADGVDITLADGSVIDASLLVAADGARSKLRERAGIATHGWDYDQSGIVVTVGHERDHHGRAEEHFLPAGPFAILPLKGERSSIVWTEQASEATRIVALPDREFHGELERRFGLKLGEIEAVGPRRAFPLGLSVARTFVSERVALVGDAAPVIHPIAGQGLNLGLRDVAALAEALAAVRHHDDGGCDRRTEPAVLQSLGCAAHRARRGAWSGGAHAADEGVLHPRGGRFDRRGAEAFARRGAVSFRVTTAARPRSAP